MTGLEYGNARLRARRSRLLDAGDYRLLVEAGSLDRMLGILAETPYRIDVEAAVARHQGLQRLDGAVRSHLARNLRDLVAFYRDPRVPIVDLLLERWDLHNVRAILRMQAHPEPALDLDPLIVPAGRLNEAELAELAAQRGLRGAVDLLVAWRLPSVETAHRLVGARAAFEAGEGTSAIEAALNEVYAAHLDAVLGAEAGDEPARLLRSEIDARNVMTALRQSAAGDAGEAAVPPAERYLPGGSLDAATLEAARVAATPAVAAAALLQGHLPSGWDGAIVAWQRNADLVALEETVRAAIVRRAVGLFHRGDPLGPAIPVAYAFAKEAEARNLRMIGRALVHQIEPAELERHLVVVA